MRSGSKAALPARSMSLARPARILRTYLPIVGQRMKLLVHDGIGVWLATGRLNRVKFDWSRDVTATVALTRRSLPRQRIGDAGVITVF